MVTMSNDDDRSLNTPKSAQVREFFRRNPGIRDITSSWRWHKNPPDRTTMLLDGLVNLRGSIAYRGSPPGGSSRSTPPTVWT
jgi:hypothetical protein